MTLTEVLPATAARLGVATAAGTIADDDAAPVLTIADNNAHESAGTISFPVTLDAESALQVMVNYVTESRDATAGEDYTWVADTLVFRPGERSRMISVPIRQDDLVEAEQEHFAVTLSGPVNATLGAQTATGSIIDDDTLLLSVAADSATVIEGAAATFTVEATGATSTGRVVVGYTVGGTASAGSDYTAVAAGTITFTLGGSRRQTVTVATLEDQLDEPAERFMVTLTGAQPSSAASLGTTTATGVHHRRRRSSPRRPRRHPCQRHRRDAGRGDLRHAPDRYGRRLLQDFSFGQRYGARSDRPGQVRRSRLPGHRGQARTSTYTSPNNDNYDTVRVTGGPGKVYVRVSGASAARYDLAVWVLDSSTSDSSYDIELRYIGTPSREERPCRGRHLGRGDLPLSPHHSRT